MDSLRKNFKRILREKGLKQKEVAHRAGISPSQISRIIQFNEGTELGSILKLARGLDVPPSALFGHETKVAGIDALGQQVFSMWQRIEDDGLKKAVLKMLQAAVGASPTTEHGKHPPHKRTGTGGKGGF